MKINICINIISVKKKKNIYLYPVKMYSYTIEFVHKKGICIYIKYVRQGSFIYHCYNLKKEPILIT